MRGGERRLAVGDAWTEEEVDSAEEAGSELEFESGTGYSNFKEESNGVPII